MAEHQLPKLTAVAFDRSLVGWPSLGERVSDLVKSHLAPLFPVPAGNTD